VRTSPNGLLYAGLVAARLSGVRVYLDDDHLEVRLAPWQRLLGLMRDIRVARADVSDVRVVADPVREAMRAGIKVGLRVPWLCFVARTIRLDEAFVVRRGVPGLSFAVENQGRLRRVLLSTPEAGELAHKLRGGD
jgi:hypothetical protein